MRNVISQFECTAQQLVDVGSCTIDSLVVTHFHIVGSTQVLDVTEEDTRFPLLAIHYVNPVAGVAERSVFTFTSLGIL